MDAVFDYFNAEIFQSLSKSIREFLMATAYLPYVAVTIAEELTGNTDAKDILERCHRRNLFTHRILDTPNAPKVRGGPNRYIASISFALVASFDSSLIEACRDSASKASEIARNVPVYRFAATLASGWSR